MIEDFSDILYEDFNDILYKEISLLRHSASFLRGKAAALGDCGLGALANELDLIADGIDDSAGRLKAGWNTELSRQTEQSQTSSRLLLEAIFAGMAVAREDE